LRHRSNGVLRLAKSVRDDSLVSSFKPIDDRSLGFGPSRLDAEGGGPLLSADLVRDVACARYILLKRGRHASGWVDSAGWL
jgi:hypothetical protein